MPLIGTWGQLDTDPAAKKVVFAITRGGFMLPYETAAGPCAPASWPRFHHDNANSGAYGPDIGRDAVAPGKPGEAKLFGSTLSFKAPGDDLLCGKADHYEVVSSDGEISARRFRAEQNVPNPPAPGDPGTTQTVQVPAGAQSVGIRAVDDQGNRGRLAVASRGPGAGSGTGSGGGGSGSGTGKNGSASCLARRSKITSRRIGRVRIGDTKAQLQRRAGAPSRKRARAWRYCVAGGGRVLVAFSAKGRIRLVATTAPRQGYGKLRRGSKRSRYRRLHPHRLSRGLYRGAGRSRTIAFRVRRRKVSFIAVADSALARSPRKLRAYVRLAGL